MKKEASRGIPLSKTVITIRLKFLIILRYMAFWMTLWNVSDHCQNHLLCSFHISVLY